MDYLRSKLNYRLHDQVEKFLDHVYASGGKNNLEKFLKLQKRIGLMFKSCRILEKEYPDDLTVKHNSDVLSVCLTSIVLAEQAILAKYFPDYEKSLPKSRTPPKGNHF